MSSLLFWNINNKPIHRLIRALVVQYAVDVLVLAECSVSEARIEDFHLLRGRLLDEAAHGQTRVHSPDAAPSVR